RFDAPRGVRTATVAGRQMALDRSLLQDLAAGFAGRAGAQGAGQERFAEDRFGAERHSGDWLGGVRLEDGRPLRAAGQRPSSGRGALLDGFSYALSPLSPAAGGGGWSIWGRIDSGEFSGTSDGVEFDGSKSNAWLGFDRRSEAGILSGMAFSSTGADADYTLGKFGAAIETSLSIVLPYVEISTDDGVAGHIMLGVVSGDATLTQTDQMEGTADLSMYLMSAGGSWPAAEFGSATLSWAGDISFSTLQTSGSELAALRDLSASSMQIRGGAELVHSGFGEAVTATPRIALQLRHDAGDGITGTGVELSAGLRMLSASERLSVDLSARSLTTHSAEDLSDWGAGLQLRLHPKGGGEGLGFALGPTWGNAEDDDLLERDDAFGLDGADLRRRQVRAQHRGMAGNIGYGLRTLGGLLTPYSEYRYTGGEYGGARQVAGVKFADGERLDLRLFSERQVSGRGETRSRLAVELQRRF
nr:hypothetical protein [Gammaproteobacteria bacterium AqS3]